MASNDDNSLIDVLVVGAGPVGLLFANELRRYNCSFRIVDRNLTGSEHSKAFGIMSRTMEVLDNRNLLDPFLLEGQIISDITLRSENRTLASFTVNGADSSFPYPLFLAQVKTEQFLENALLESGAAVERGVSLVRYEEDEVKGMVVATLIRREENGTEQEEVVKAKYLVGCDGVHSAVRKGRPDWTFDGIAYNSLWVLADLKLQSEHVKPGGISLILNPKGPVAIFPFNTNENRYRVMTILGNISVDDSNKVTHGIQDERHQLGPVQSAPLTLDELSTLVNQRAAPERLELSDPLWINTFRINERMVNGFRRGRVFVVGDAAHCHSPIGAQGMNMGLQDANNLAWKLSLVLHNRSQNPELLLDSYSSERSPIAAYVLRLTGFMTSFVANPNYFAAMARRYLMPAVLNNLGTRSALRSNVLGIWIRYPDSPINPRPARQSTWFSSLFSSPPPSLIPSGDHLPDGFLKLARRRTGADTLTLYDVLRGTTTHTLLLLVRDHPVLRASNPLVARAMDLGRQYRSTIRVVVVALSSSVDQSQLNDEAGYVAEGTFVEPKPVLHERLGVHEGHQAIIFVRPDQYVILSAIEKEVGEGAVEKFLRSYLVEDENL